jgi:restriction system protein
MRPLLAFAADGKEHTLGEATAWLARHFDLTDDELGELLPSGSQPIFINRVGWAKSYLKKAGMLSYPVRARFKIEPRGREALDNGPQLINVAYLRTYPDFAQYYSTYANPKTKQPLLPPEPDTEELDPKESIEKAVKALRDALADEILKELLDTEPSAFERIVVDVLLAMGYGGNRFDAGRALGRSGDEGVDGVIKEDQLGLDSIYIQAKRWKSGVGRPDVQQFYGALAGQNVTKGIFITTSFFTKEAREYVMKIDKRIVLIDGKLLAELMINHGVGVITVSTYLVQRIDEDFFANG